MWRCRAAALGCRIREFLPSPMTTSAHMSASPPEWNASQHAGDRANHKQLMTAPTELSLSVDPTVARALRLLQLGGPLAQPTIAIVDLLGVTDQEDRCALEGAIRWSQEFRDQNARLLFRLMRHDGERVGVIGSLRSKSTVGIELKLGSTMRRPHGARRRTSDKSSRALSRRRSFMSENRSSTPIPLSQS